LAVTLLPLPDGLAFVEHSSDEAAFLKRTGATPVQVTSGSDFRSATPVHSIGFRIAVPGPSAAPLESTRVEIRLRHLGSTVGKLQADLRGPGRHFIGLSSSRPFTEAGFRSLRPNPGQGVVAEGLFAGAAAVPVALPETGDVPEVFRPFDAELRAFLDESCFPGLTAAVTYDGRLVYRRSFGWSDPTHREPLHHDSPMALASLSKPLTKTLARDLLRSGLLRPDDTLVSRLGLTPPDGQAWVPGFTEITLAHLMEHRSGLPRVRPDGTDVGQRLNLGRSATFAEVLAWAGTRPLSFPPGTRESYSNFGYGALGAMCEAVTGKRFEACLAERITLPLGATSIRAAPEAPHTAPEPADTFPAATYAHNPAAGGLTASAPDYCRFLRAYRLSGAPKPRPNPPGNLSLTFHGSIDEALTLARQHHRRGHALEWVIFCNDRGHGGLDPRTARHLLPIRDFPEVDWFPPR
jgi:CubicO group peptidase (beta-lactamase class C family)